ncbi:MAG: hypothetical protein V4857_17625 [Pseudomonadota bacterium]
MAAWVDSNGHILLGKQFAGRRFTILVHPDGRLELVPTPEAATSNIVGPHGESAAPATAARDSTWALENREAIAFYARQVAQHGTAADELARYMDENPDPAKIDDGKI